MTCLVAGGTLNRIWGAALVLVNTNTPGWLTMQKPPTVSG